MLVKRVYREETEKKKTTTCFVCWQSAAYVYTVKYTQELDKSTSVGQAAVGAGRCLGAVSTGAIVGMLPLPFIITEEEPKEEKRSARLQNGRCFVAFPGQLE